MTKLQAAIERAKEVYEKNKHDYYFSDEMGDALQDLIAAVEESKSEADYFRDYLRRIDNIMIELNRGTKKQDVIQAIMDLDGKQARNKDNT